GDVTVLHVLATEEISPTIIGDLDVVDAESGEHVPVSLSHDSVKSYREVVDRWLLEAAARCRSRGAAYQQVMADEPIDDVVLKGWREHGVVR
ncbi:MAG: hypothetical protein Q7V62_14975, partial [Actinomycetota bacterium]|nr:hypothetical protein [Actinomycetota bacterium]